MMTIAAVDIDEFSAFFVERGHKACERAFGVSNPVLRQLIARGGGPLLLERRRAVQRCGRKAGMR